MFAWSFNKNIPCVLLVSFFCLWSGLSFATNDNLYQVEMIVFSRFNTTSLSSEQWPTINPSTVKLTQLGPERYQNYLKSIDWRLQPPSRFYMTPLAAKLKSAHYKILMHLAWQQQVLSPRNSKPIHLYGGAAYSDNGQLLATSSDDNVPFDHFRNWQVNGNLGISLNRYFNLNFNLVFAEPLNIIKQYDNSGYFSGMQKQFVYFHLDQSRRTRSDELNYIDFPLYGVLFEVKKVV